MNHQNYDIAIIGAGFSGLYMLIKARELGLSAKIFEKAPEVGGAWYWNKYPGCRCDVESVEYSYEFDKNLQQDWVWPERYSAQPEILEYIKHVASRYDLASDIAFNTTVQSLSFDEENSIWNMTTDNGINCAAKYVVAATGPLSVPAFPSIDGRDDFLGRSIHTGLWPQEGIDLAGKRVAVIGTGSSGIQVIPIIAEQADHLTVYSRTPSYTAPARNKPLSKGELESIKTRYDELRADEKNRKGGFGSLHPNEQSPMIEHTDSERREKLEQWWEIGGLAFLQAYPETMIDLETNTFIAEFIREKIEKLIDDPKKAEILMPQGTVGSRRLCSETNFYQTFNRENVSLIDAKKHSIKRVAPEGIETDLGMEKFDVIVYATGFDALTGALNKMEVRGRKGETLREKWREGPNNYLGLQLAGFPNLFMVNGPGSVCVFSNMVQTIEHHVNFITGCIAKIERDGASTIEATVEAETAWTNHMREVADETLIPKGESWYVGANIPGKPNMIMAYVGGFPAYMDKCQEVVDRDYEGFEMS